MVQLQYLHSPTLMHIIGYSGIAFECLILINAYSRTFSPPPNAGIVEHALSSLLHLEPPFCSIFFFGTQCN